MPRAESFTIGDGDDGLIEAKPNRRRSPTSHDGVRHPLRGARPGPAVSPSRVPAASTSSAARRSTCARIPAATAPARPGQRPHRHDAAPPARSSEPPRPASSTPRASWTCAGSRRPSGAARGNAAGQAVRDELRRQQRRSAPAHDRWSRATTSRPPASTCCSGPPTARSRSRRGQEAAARGRHLRVTINTAVAMRVNGHRVGFYRARTGLPTVMSTASRSTGGDSARPTSAPARGSPRTRSGYQLDLSDGTSGLGPLARGGVRDQPARPPIGRTAAPRVGPARRRSRCGRAFAFPRLPDGSALPRRSIGTTAGTSCTRSSRPAWRVTPGDVACSTTRPADAATRTRRRGSRRRRRPLSDRGPRPGRPSRRLGRRAAGVTDPDLADECAFDVATTGSTST